MHNDAAPAFRFNRPISPSLGAPTPPRHPSRPRKQPAPAKPRTDAAKPNEGPAGSANQGAVEADAERFLRQANGDPSQPVGSPDWLKKAGLNIRRASDAQHLEAIALAYATHVRIQASPLKAAIVAELETLSGRKRSRTTTDLHLVVERFVSYGGETPAERLAARKLVSRDVRAIRHLEAARVLPSRVRTLAAAPGEGLHAWARQAAVARQITVDPPRAVDEAKKAKAEARQRALVHEVVITTRRVDGTRKARRRYKFTGALGSEFAGLLAQLSGLERRAERKA